MSISMDPRLGDEVRVAAERAGVSVSAWLAQAAVVRLRKQALVEFLSDWQTRHGRITAAELTKARTELGHGEPKRR